MADLTPTPKVAAGGAAAAVVVIVAFVASRFGLELPVDVTAALAVLLTLLAAYVKREKPEA